MRLCKSYRTIIWMHCGIMPIFVRSVVFIGHLSSYYDDLCTIHDMKGGNHEYEVLLCMTVQCIICIKHSTLVKCCIHMLTKC